MHKIRKLGSFGIQHSQKKITVRQLKQLIINMLCKKSSFWQLKQLTYTPRKKKIQLGSWSSWCIIPHQSSNTELVVQAVEVEQTCAKNRTIGQVKQLIVDKHAKNKRLWQFKQLTYTAVQKKLHLGSYNRNMEVKSVDLTGKCL